MTLQNSAAQFIASNAAHPDLLALLADSPKYQATYTTTGLGNGITRIVAHLADGSKIDPIAYLPEEQAEDIARYSCPIIVGYSSGDNPAGIAMDCMIAITVYGPLCAEMPAIDGEEYTNHAILRSMLLEQATALGIPAHRLCFPRAN